MKISTKTSRWSKVDIEIAGKNVSTDLAPYLTSLTLNEKTSTEVDNISLELDDRDGLFIDDWFPERGDTIRLSILTYNREEDGDEEQLNCGTFEIDLVTHKSSPASSVTISAVSTLNSNIRREIHNKKWENTTLMQICLSIAERNGMKLYWQGEDCEIKSCDQTDMMDLQFLAKLGEDNDFVIKINADSLYILDQVTLESAKPVMQLSRFDFSSCSAAAQAFDLYKEAVASYYVPINKKPKTARVKHNEASDIRLINPEWYKEHSKPRTVPHRAGSRKPPKTEKVQTQHYLDKANIKGGGKILYIRQKFDSEEQARKTALARLRQKNRGEYRISAELPGNPFILSGFTVDIVDYGKYNGRYFIDGATHKLSKGGGYSCSFVAHKCLGTVDE